MNKIIKTETAIGIIIIIAIIIGVPIWLLYGQLQKVAGKNIKPSIKILSPKGGEQICFGEDYQIRWRGTKVKVARIGIIYGNALMTSQYLGVSPVNSDSETGSYTWNVGKLPNGDRLKAGDYIRLSIQNDGEHAYDQTDGLVKIVNCE